MFNSTMHIRKIILLEMKQVFKKFLLKEQTMIINSKVQANFRIVKIKTTFQTHTPGSFSLPSSQ